MTFTAANTNDNSAESQTPVSRRQLLAMGGAAAALFLSACGDSNNGYDDIGAPSSTQQVPPTTAPISLSEAGKYNLELFRTAASLELAAVATYSQLAATKVTTTGEIIFGTDSTVTTTTVAGATTTTLPATAKPITIFKNEFRKGAVDRAKTAHDAHLKYFQGYVGRLGGKPVTNPNSVITDLTKTLFATLKSGGFASQTARDNLEASAMATLNEIDQIIADTYQSFAGLVRVDGYADKELTAARQFRVAFLSCGLADVRLAAYSELLLGASDISNAFANPTKDLDAGKGLTN